MWWSQPRQCRDVSGAIREKWTRRYQERRASQHYPSAASPIPAKDILELPRRLSQCSQVVLLRYIKEGIRPDTGIPGDLRLQRSDDYSIAAGSPPLGNSVDPFENFFGNMNRR